MRSHLHQEQASVAATGCWSRGRTVSLMTRRRLQRWSSYRMLWKAPWTSRFLWDRLLLPIDLHCRCLRRSALGGGLGMGCHELLGSWIAGSGLHRLICWGLEIIGNQNAVSPIIKIKVAQMLLRDWDFWICSNFGMKVFQVVDYQWPRWRSSLS